MGSKRYVDDIVLRVFGCKEGTYPLPENLERAWQRRFQLGSRVDREALLSEIEGTISPQPFELQERYSHFSWGADGAMLEIAIGVSSGTAVVVIERLIDAVLKRAKKPQKEPPTAEAAADSARDFLARARSIAAEDVQVDGLEAMPNGFHVRLSTAKGERYVVEVDAESDVYRLSRQSMDG